MYKVGDKVILLEKRMKIPKCLAHMVGTDYFFMKGDILIIDEITEGKNTSVYRISDSDDYTFVNDSAIESLRELKLKKILDV